MEKQKQESRFASILTIIVVVLSVAMYFSGYLGMFMAREETNYLTLKMSFGLMISGAILSLVGLFLTRNVPSLKDLGGIPSLDEIGGIPSIDEIGGIPPLDKIGSIPPMEKIR